MTAFGRRVHREQIWSATPYQADLDETCRHFADGRKAYIKQRRDGRSAVMRADLLLVGGLPPRSWHLTARDSFQNGHSQHRLSPRLIFGPARNARPASP